MQRLHRSKEANRWGHTKPRKLSRPLCVDVHATQCIISRNGTLTSRLWSLCGAKSHTKRQAGARHCLRKTDKLLESSKGKRVSSLSDRNCCLVLPAVRLIVERVLPPGIHGISPTVCFTRLGASQDCWKILLPLCSPEHGPLPLSRRELLIPASFVKFSHSNR